MTVLQQQLLECDRCEAQFTDEQAIRQLGIYQRSAVLQNGVYSNPDKGRRTEFPTADLCKECIHDFQHQWKAWMKEE